MWKHSIVTGLLFLLCVFFLTLPLSWEGSDVAVVGEIKRTALEEFDSSTRFTFRVRVSDG